MSKNKSSLIVPALIGGFASGFLSSLPLANCFCCLWIILGAGLAVYLYSRDNPKALTSSDGLLLGILTGLIATITDFFLSIPFQAINLALSRHLLEWLSQFAEDVPFHWEQWLERGKIIRLGFPLIFVVLIFRAMLYTGLGAIGGALGVVLFGRKKGQTSIEPP